jgi:outer membrane protein TolC
LIEGAESAVTAAKLGEQAAAAYVGQQTRETYYEWVRAKLQVLIQRRQLLQVQRSLEQVRAIAAIGNPTGAAQLY